MFADVVKNISQELHDRKASRKAALAAWATHKPRIFERGMTADGKPIGTYSEKYGEKRRALGKEASFVNLEYSGQMKKDYQPSTSGEVGYGFINQHNVDKSYWVEEMKDANIFELSVEEEDIFIDILGKELVP